MTKLQHFFRPKKWEITISPLTSSIQVEVEKPDASDYFYDCIDIHMDRFQDYAQKMGYLDSYYDSFDPFMDSYHRDIVSIPFEDWMSSLEEYQLMMMVLNFLYDKKVLSC